MRTKFVDRSWSNFIFYYLRRRDFWTEIWSLALLEFLLFFLNSMNAKNDCKYELSILSPCESVSGKIGNFQNQISHSITQYNFKYFFTGDYNTYIPNHISLCGTITKGKNTVKRLVQYAHWLRVTGTWPLSLSNLPVTNRTIIHSNYSASPCTNIVTFLESSVIVVKWTISGIRKTQFRYKNAPYLGYFLSVFKNFTPMYGFWFVLPFVNAYLLAFQLILYHFRNKWRIS